MTEQIDADGGLITHSDGRRRCRWCGKHDDYIAYHDLEWGRPSIDDRHLFEKISLEGFQAGLSWLTILRKRENFRRAFAEFDFEKIARFNSRSVERLLRDPGIVRHRGKIEAVLNNARRCLELIEECGSLAAFVWSFEPPPEERPDTADWQTLRRITQSPQSEALSRGLRKRGWKFVGPTTMYAFLQSEGIVNDHVEGCWVREVVEDERAGLERPHGAS